MTKIVCVYKSGGIYTPKDVYALKRQTDAAADGSDFEFVCLSDAVLDIETEPLLHGWKGWWSVQEMFRLKGPAVALGLDTVLPGSLRPFIDAAESLSEKEFGLLRPFGKIEKWSNGIMCWNGDFSFIYSRFKSKPEEFRRAYFFEHRFTINTLETQGIRIVPIQDLDGCGGVISYKWGCVKNGPDGEIRPSTEPPSGTSIVCFHGTPRPWEVNDAWVKKLREYPDPDQADIAPSNQFTKD